MSDNKLLLLSVSRDKIAAVHDMATLLVQRTIPLHNSVSSMLVLPDNLVLDGQADGQVATTF